MQFGAGRGVLQRNGFTWADVSHGAKGCQSGLVKTTQNKFLFARVVVDVAHGKDARRASASFAYRQLRHGKQIDPDADVLRLVRLGSHSELGL